LSIPEPLFFINVHDDDESTCGNNDDPDDHPDNDPDNDADNDPDDHPDNDPYHQDRLLMLMPVVAWQQ